MVYPVLNALGAEPTATSILVVEGNSFLDTALQKVSSLEKRVLEAASADEAIVLLSPSRQLILLTDAQMWEWVRLLAEHIKREHSALQ